MGMGVKKPAKVAPWSYSRIKAFETCPKQFYHTHILKEFPFKETEAMRYGTEFHKAAEDFIRDGKPVPDRFAFARPALQVLADKPGDKHCEMKVGLTEDLEPCGFFDKKVWFRGVVDLIIVDGDTATIVDYKGLALDTPLPTPSGWTTMGGVAVGDTLFDMDGNVCTVTGKSEVKRIDCYRITFDDGSEVVCDHEHLWRLSDGSVKRVTDITWGRNKKQRTNVPCVDVAKSLRVKAVDLPVDPYVMGLWIADGTRNTGVISKPDLFIWEEIQRRGYDVNMDSGEKEKCPTRTVKGLRTQLRKAGFIADKLIPEMYLRAGEEQRLDLLRGLMDGDGSANPTRKQCVYMTTDRFLASQVSELLRSLGQRPSVATTKQFGFGLTVTAHPVSFRPNGINPFLIPRKAERVDPAWGPGRSNKRRIDKIERVESVPTQCISVDSPTRTFLCTEHMIPTHNTGKSARYADKGQLELMALTVFKHFPDVQKVRAGLLFVIAKEFVRAKYDTDDEPEMWQKWLADYGKMVKAAETDVWNPRPSGLCRAHCPVTQCPHNGAS
jgi:hypothetical protein